MLIMRIKKGEVLWSDLRFESKTQSDQSYYAWLQKVLAKAWVWRSCIRQGEEGPFLPTTFVNHEASSRPRVSDISIELQESHVHGGLWEVYTNFRGFFARLTMLPVLGDRNTMGVVLEGDRQGKSGPSTCWAEPETSPTSLPRYMDSLSTSPQTIKACGCLGECRSKCRNWKSTHHP